MIFDNNILPVICAILPAIAYIVIIYKVIPKNLVSIGRAKRYLSIGLISPMLVFLVHYLFPGAWTETTMFFLSDWELLIKMFIEVAFVEEMTKYFTFQWVSSSRRSRKFDLPVATMFYAMMASAGFAIVENIYYLMNHGEDVLLIRAVTAIIVHIACGLIMGYFLGKSKFISSEYNKHKLVKRPKTERIKKVALLISGILAATLFHGFYDYSLSTSSGNIYTTILIMGWGVITSVYLVKEMIRDSKKHKDKYLVNHE